MSGLLPAEIKSLLLKAAERDADEVLYADLIIDQISPEESPTSWLRCSRMTLLFMP